MITDAKINYNIICNGVFDLTTFNKHKKQIKG